MNINGFQDTIDWYDHNAEQYAKAGADFFDLNHIDTFISKLPADASILDVGCGAGRDMGIFSEKGIDVTGIDISKGLLEVGKAKLPHLTFVEGNFISMPFPDESFDGAWSNTSLLHLETVADVKAALAEIHRVLKPGGILHVVVKAQTGSEKTAIVVDKLSHHDRFFQYFTLDELSRLLQESGFSMLQIKQYNETETIPNGRPEVELIWALAQKP